MNRIQLAVVFGLATLVVQTSAQARGGTTPPPAQSAIDRVASIRCGASLDVGTIVARPGNASAIVVVSDQAGAIAASSNTSVSTRGGSPVACSIGSGGALLGDATAALSSTNARWTIDRETADGMLTGVVVRNGKSALVADVTLSKTTGLGDETLFIGGALHVPANFKATGSYASAPIVLTITE